MPICIRGAPFTFQTTFLDSVGDYLEPTGVVIDVFYFDDSGDKQVLITDAAMASLGDGQYSYFYTPAVASGVTLSAWMRGDDGGSQVSAEQEVLVIERVPFGLSR